MSEGFKILLLRCWVGVAPKVTLGIVVWTCWNRAKDPIRLWDPVWVQINQYPSYDEHAFCSKLMLFQWDGIYRIAISFFNSNLVYGERYTKCMNNKHILLPPANEVWGKVIFSEACVKNSVHRGGWLLGGMHICRGHAWLQGGVHGCRGNVWLLGVCMVAGAMCVCEGVHGCRGACMVAGGYAWLLGGVHGCRGHVWLLGACMVAQVVLWHLMAHSAPWVHCMSNKIGQVCGLYSCSPKTKYWGV